MLRHPRIACGMPNGPGRRGHLAGCLAPLSGFWIPHHEADLGELPRQLSTAVYEAEIGADAQARVRRDQRDRDAA